ADTSVTPPMPRSLQAPVRNGVVLLVSLLAIGACTANGPLSPSNSPVARHSPSPSPSPLPSPEESPSPSPTPTIEPTPVAVPSWAALHASCAGQPAAQEALLMLQGATNPVLADVADPKAPRTLCSLSGGAFQPQLVTQTTPTSPSRPTAPTSPSSRRLPAPAISCRCAESSTAPSPSACPGARWPPGAAPGAGSTSASRPRPWCRCGTRRPAYLRPSASSFPGSGLGQASARTPRSS